MQRPGKGGGNLPREDSAGEVVYDQINETLHVIDGAEHGDIGVPDFIWARGPEARRMILSSAVPARHVKAKQVRVLVEGGKRERENTPSRIFFQ